MLKAREKFRSGNGKRKVLIVDDELINRELLKLILEDEYDTYTAPDGETALQLAHEHGDTFSVIMLDLLMPGMHGIEVIRHLKEDPTLQQIPIIVLTADSKAEVQSLKEGAVDFITKPYPEREVILARIQRTIELSEDREIIQSTERDSLTGLYNREYFFHYCQLFDQSHKEMDMDAIVLDVHHFSMINERYGKAYGDTVLRRIGGKVRALVRDSGGIVCRREADTFLAYCPHREDYQLILDTASIGLSGDDAAANRVRLRMGVYAHADKSIDLERRFDRAQMAADTIRSNYMSSFALYNNELHENEIYAERLLEDFQSAIENKEFKVYFQPKFDIRPEVPMLASAEALVRWVHPELGFISPGKFIPLFEENGLIQQLDLYVWRETAAQIRDWKDRLGISVPISVNVSRVDMYDPNLIQTFENLLRQYDISSDELLLEITESAYTQDSTQIISKVNHLRDLGFHIEMDDFGTGYSSLNMISTLPIDALKLDMTFIRNAFKDGGDTRLIEVIIDIADYLHVPVIAEGVETEEQLNTLKAMGCDLVQGYYFSKPVPAAEYEPFILEKKRRLLEPAQPAAESRSVKEWIEQEVRLGDRTTSNSIARALTTGFEVIYYVDTRSGHYVQFSAKGRYEELQIERSGSDFFGDTMRNIPRVVCEDDRERVAASMQRETLLSQLIDDQPFTMTYRLLIDDKPTYYSLRAVRAFTNDEHHIVIGVSNVQDRIRLDSVQGAALQDRGAEFTAIANALSSDFESVYYVDTVTDNYIEFTSQGSYESLQIECSGMDFFRECQTNLRKVVYPDDQRRVSESLRKKVLMDTLAVQRVQSLVYRLMIDGKPLYYRMKIVMAEDGQHLVIGVGNVMSQIAQEREIEAAEANKVPFASIAQALAADYFSIYYVDIETDHFIEYSADESYDTLGIEKDGDDFFNLSRKNILRVVHPDDHDKILAAFTKENLLAEMARTGTFTLNYRLMFGDEVNYVAMKATRMVDPNDPHIVIGVNNINAQLERDQEYEKAKRDSVTFASIAEALAADYFSIYYVNTDTDRFIEYSADSEYNSLGIEKSGDDFFNLSRKNIARVVHPEDLDKVLAAFTKENLLTEMKQTGTFTLTYRLMFGDKVNYVALKATRMSDQNDPHIVIGVNNINAQMQRQMEYDAARAQSDIYSHIAQALAREYYSIYLVNTETDEFIEYSSNQNYRELKVEQSGVDFFKDCRRNVLRLVYKEDLEKALAVWEKSRLMPQLEGGKTFSTTYRLMMEGTPVYINCKVLRMESELDSKYIVIGVSNVDEQMRREHEMVAIREKANRDALTGAKSKHAYVDAVAEINTQIDMGSVQPFAVVVCDVNGLKTINDTLGHQAGDKLIREASEAICGIFQHSPVYRVGGDEFVVILRGRDYLQRTSLMEQMTERNHHNMTDGLVIACGASEWRTGVDNRFESVFDRADTAMYENKSALKTGREKR